MCWCAAGFRCSGAEDFRIHVGELQLVAAPAGLDRTCVAGQTCALKQIGNLEGSAFLVLDTCGTGSVPRGPGFRRVDSAATGAATDGGLTVAAAVGHDASGP